jgi:hypothetical protein
LGCCWGLFCCPRSLCLPVSLQSSFLLLPPPPLVVKFFSEAFISSYWPVTNSTSQDRRNGWRMGKPHHARRNLLYDLRRNVRPHLQLFLLSHVHLTLTINIKIQTHLHRSSPPNSFRPRILLPRNGPASHPFQKVRR